MNFKPLIGYWHSVDLVQVKEALDEIPCDKIQVSYFDYPYPQRKVLEYFKENPEYTHLILIPNDLVYNLRNFTMTERAVRELDPPVLCGLCNVDLGQYKDFWNVCPKLPTLEFTQRRYRWMAESQRLHHLNLGFRFIPVKFAGFPAMCVRRDVFDKCKINEFNESIKTKEVPIWESQLGYANDLMFCHNLSDLEITIVCDLENTMLHLRFQGEKQNGKKQPNVHLVKSGEKIN